LFTHLGDRHAAIALQQIENLQVNAVRIGHFAAKAEKWPWVQLNLLLLDINSKKYSAINP
jgi:hypothetical protein